MQLLRITRMALAAVTVLALTANAALWAQDTEKKKKKNAVTKVLKKVDRQILSYSPDQARTSLEPVLEDGQIVEKRAGVRMMFAIE